MESLMRRRWLSLLSLVLLLPLLSLPIVSCQTAGSGASIKSADPDFDVLETRIEQYREVQQAALQQFEATGQQLSGWSSHEVTDLQALYAATAQQDDASIEVAIEVSAAINSIEEAAEAAFKEWQIAVDLNSDAQLRAESQKRLGETRQRYADMLQVLRQCEAKTSSVLAALNSNEEYFKDHLDPGEVASRQPQLNALRNDVQSLVYRMNIALDSTEAFINSIE
jgi:Mg2+ and Co2+ transporter CorA